MAVTDTAGTDPTARVSAPLQYTSPSRPEGYDDILFNAIKNILTVGGGIVGAGGGTMLEPGGGTVAGGLAGAGLGRGAGEAIHNLYKQQSGQPVDVNSPYKAIPEGAGLEMGGQVGGKLLGALAQKLAPIYYQSVGDVLEGEGGNLRKEFHGSKGPILEPVPGKVFTGTKGDQVYYTTPDYRYAQDVGRMASAKSGNYEGYGNVVVTPNLMSKVPQLDIHTPISKADAFKLGEMLDFPKEDVISAAKDSITPEGVDANNFWDALAKFRAVKKYDGDYLAAGADMSEKVKDAGYRRMSINIDPGTGSKETIHYFPQEDLYPVGSAKLAELKQRLAMGKKEPLSPLSQKMIDIFSKSAMTEAK